MATRTTISPMIAHGQEEEQRQESESDYYSWKHLILYPTLRSSLAGNLVAAFFLSFYLTEATVWFKMARLRESDFPYVVLAYGPWKLDQSSYRKRMDLDEWEQEACAPEEADRYEFTYWMENLMAKWEQAEARQIASKEQPPNSANNAANKAPEEQKQEEEECVDQAGYQCRLWAREGAAFHKVCTQKNHMAAIVQARCRLSCGLCTDTSSEKQDNEKRDWVITARHTKCSSELVKIPYDTPTQDLQQCKANTDRDRGCGKQIYMNEIGCRCVRKGQFCDKIPSQRSTLYEFRKIGQRNMNEQAAAFCKFRSAVVSALTTARFTLGLSLAVILLTVPLIFCARWNAKAVFLSFLVQLFAFLNTIWGLWPLFLRKHGIPEEVIVEFRSYLLQKQADKRMDGVNKLFADYVNQYPNIMVELMCVLIGTAIQTWAMLHTMRWFWYVTTRHSPPRCHCFAHRRWWDHFIACLSRCKSICACCCSTDHFSTEYAPYRFMGRRPGRCGCFSIPPYIGRVWADFFALLSHWWRCFEWDGFLGRGSICSEKEKEQLEQMGIKDRSVQNVLVWRRSVLTLALIFGVLLMPFGYLHVSESMKRSVHAVHASGTTAPRDWEEFKKFFKQKKGTFSCGEDEEPNDGILSSLQRKVINAQNRKATQVRAARYDDYLRCMSRQWGSMVMSMELEARMWVAIVELAVDWISVGLVFLGLVSFLWLRTSRKFIIVCGLLQVYAPVGLSFLQMGSFIKESAFREMDAFMASVGEETAEQMTVYDELASCWDRIDRVMGDIYKVTNITYKICGAYVTIVGKNGAGALTKLTKNPGINASYHFCKTTYDAMNVRLKELSDYQGKLRGACIGFQRTVLGDVDHRAVEGEFDGVTESLVLAQKKAADKQVKTITKVYHQGLVAFTGIKAGANSFMAMLPSTISMLPSALSAAWRVRLVLPLERLPCTMVRALPMIYLPLFWIQFLPFWQLLNHVYLFIGVLLLMASSLSFSFTADLFRAGEPMPSKQLAAAIVKQGYVSIAMHILAYIWLAGWVLSHSRARGFRNMFLTWMLSRRGVHWSLKFIYKFFLLRVMAMDFILRQMTVNHLFDLGLEAMRRVSTTRQLKSHSEDGIQSAKASRSEHLEGELAAELAAGIYGEKQAQEINWESIAIKDVLESEKKHRRAIEAILKLQEETAIEPVTLTEADAEESLIRRSIREPRRTETEMSEFSGARRRFSGQQPNFTSDGGLGFAAAQTNDPAGTQRTGQAESELDSDARFGDLMAQFRPHVGR